MQDDAQLAISHLHKRKVGSKRRNISHVPADDDSLPKKEVIALLQSVPGGEIALFKFSQMYEERFRSTISVAELHRMNEVVTITDDVDGVGRMVQLKTDEVFGFGELEQKLVFCEVHRPTNQTGDGVGKVWEGLPDVVVELHVLAANIHKMLKTHEGSVPLASLLHCYNAECSPPLQEVGNDSAGVALEHLLQAVKGVLITTGSTGIKKLVEAVPDNIEIKYSDLVGPPPALAGQLLVFTREVVDMLKVVPGCKIHFCKFIPRYHHHFGKQCRVADYGYTKLKDLLESIPHVIQIIGEGSKTVITLAHKAQVRRFTNDLLKMLKSQPDRKFHLSSFAFVFENCFYKPFNVSDYGVCHVKDMLSEIPENIIATEEVNQNDLLISVFKRDQTEAEVMKTRGFAKEVVELLRHSPDLSIRFHKFIPAYHQHFGRQCRVGNYGMTKLVELFEAVSDTVELNEDGEERIVQLTKEKMVFVLGGQVECLIKASRARFVTLTNLENEYYKKFGHPIPLGRLGVKTVEELVRVLHSWVRVVEGKVVTIDRGFIKTMANKVRSLLLEDKCGQMELEVFKEKLATRFGSHIDVEVLARDLSYLVEVKEGKIGLTALQICARDIELVLGDPGKMPLAELELQYEEKFGRELPLELLGFDSVTGLLNAMSDTVSVKGRGNRKVVCMNKSPTTSLLSPPRPKAISFPSQPTPNNKGTVATFTGRGFDLLRTFTPLSSVPRSSSEVVQSPAAHLGPRHTPASQVHVPLTYSVPPPYYPCKSASFLVGSPQPSDSSHIPNAAPGSPVTPTTPRSFPSQYLLYPYYYSPQSLHGSPLSHSPLPTATFQQHMSQLSPSPLVTPPQTRSPYIVQPISRSVPHVGFHPSDTGVFSSWFKL